MDTGRDSAKWGSEIGLRSRLERTYATAKGVPVVLLVVQGGAGTLDFMLASAELGCPLLVLSDSGGAVRALATHPIPRTRDPRFLCPSLSLHPSRALVLARRARVRVRRQATAISQYCAEGGGIDAVEDRSFVEQEPKLAALAELHLARGSTVLTFFRLQDEDSQNNMSSAILGALFRNLMFHQTGEAVVVDVRTPSLAALLSRKVSIADKIAAASVEVLKRYRNQMQRALLLTVKWNQPGFARRILLDLPTAEHTASTRPVRKMMQHALEYQRVEIVRVLLERPGVEIAATNLCALYLQEDPYNFFRSDASLALNDSLVQNLSEISREGSTKRFFKEQYSLYKRLVGPTLHKVAPHMHAAVEAQSVASCVDIFFWAVFMGDVRLARELWAHVDNPLHCALLASNLLRTLCNSITAGKAEAEEVAEEIELWAVGVLNEIQEQELAHWLLSSKVREWKIGSTINLALQMGLKTFLAHRHCQSLMELRWRGGYPDSAVVISSQHTPWQVFVWAFVNPLANPYLSNRGDATAALRGRNLDDGDGGDGGDGSDELPTMSTDELMLGALAEAFMLKRYGEQNAVASLEKELREEAEARKAHEALRDADRKSDKAGKGMQQREQGGPNTPARDATDRFELRREQKVGPSAMASATRAHVLFKRQATSRALSKRDLIPESPWTSSSLGKSCFSLTGSTGFRDTRPLRVRRKNGFYSVPLVKYLLRAITHVLFLVLYAEVLTHLLTADQLHAISPNLPPLTTGEAVLITWSLSLGYEHRRREIEMRALGLSTALPLKTLVNWAHTVLFVAICLRLSTLLPDFGFGLGYSWAYMYAGRHLTAPPPLAMPSPPHQLHVMASLMQVLSNARLV